MLGRTENGSGTAMVGKNKAKRKVRLEIDSDLLDRAQAAGLDLSRAAERGIVRALNAVARQDWQHENAEAIRRTNSRPPSRGLST